MKARHINPQDKIKNIPRGPHRCAQLISDKDIKAI